MVELITLNELSVGQFGLLRVDPNTGTPINELGNWVKAGEERYLKFSCEIDAREYALSLLQENPLLEWSLVDSNGTQIAVINDEQALINAAKIKKKDKVNIWARLFKK